MHNHSLNGTGERKGFTFSLMEILRLGGLLASLIVFGVKLQSNVGELSKQVAEMGKAIHESADLQARQNREVASKLQGLTIASELQHDDLKHMGSLLHEKRILRSPDVTYSQAQAPSRETDPSDQTDEPKKHNAALRALKATGHILIKPFKETPETPEEK